MIRVQRADEPATFDANVRQRGIRAVHRRLGLHVPGPGRRPTKTYARYEDIPSGKFVDEWTKALPELRALYSDRCAYTALHIEHGTGDATVDHFIPISVDRRLAYEWSNYRLACGHVNTYKRVAIPLDPFEIEDEWFELELVAYQVVPGAHTTNPLRARIKATIDTILELNKQRFITQRSEYAAAYLARHITLEHLEHKAPFVARELRRQGKLITPP